MPCPETLTKAHSVRDMPVKRCWNFFSDTKFKTWRTLWIALAEAQKELGLNITQEQIDELKANRDNIDYDLAEKIEKKHVMMSCPISAPMAPCEAKGIIHLGATSCYVCDNTDIIIFHKALKLIREKVLSVILKLSRFASAYKDMPTLGYTHFSLPNW